jgi:hypothetical protein
MLATWSNQRGVSRDVVQLEAVDGEGHRVVFQ